MNHLFVSLVVLLFLTPIIYWQRMDRVTDERLHQLYLFMVPLPTAAALFVFLLVNKQYVNCATVAVAALISTLIAFFIIKNKLAITASQYLRLLIEATSLGVIWSVINVLLQKYT